MEISDSPTQEIYVKKLLFLEWFKRLLKDFENKLNLNINLPNKSIFGFKILSSFHSSIFCYILLFTGKFLNSMFGFSKIQIIAGSIFNIVLQTSVLILIINAIDKRKQIKKIYFLFLNFILFLFVPYSMYIVFKYLVVLLSFLIWNPFFLWSTY